MKELGAVAIGASATDFAAYMLKDFQKWQRVTHDTGIKLNN